MKVDERRVLVRIQVSDWDGGYSFKAAVPTGFGPGDSNDEPYCSSLGLLECGIFLGPAHAEHALIREQGTGRFSHWGETLHFSTSDNSDPRYNGREYHLFRRPPRPKVIQEAINIISNLPDAPSTADAYTAVERCLASLYPDAKLGEDLKSFWHEGDFLNSFKRLCGDNYRSLERKFTVFNLVRALSHVPGDIAECGVYNGATAYFTARATTESQSDREIFLFDSFEGLSQPAAIDGTYWTKGALAFPLELTRKNLSEFCNVHFLKGWIPSRFSEVAERTFCFVHIDVDLYEPTLDSLRYFFPRLARQGILVCDDYGFDSCPGARRAMDEFFADKFDKIVHLPTGQGLVIKS